MRESLKNTLISARRIRVICFEFLKVVICIGLEQNEPHEEGEQEDAGQDLVDDQDEEGGVAREERDDGSPIREDEDVEISETSDRDRDSSSAASEMTRPHSLQTLI